MYANGPVASGALPALPFLPDKVGYPVNPDEFKVFDHAHAVFGPVPFVEVFQSLTRVNSARITVFRLQILTVFYAAMHPCLRFVFIGPTASVAPVFLPLVGQADAAVHSAGGNQYNTFRYFHEIQNETVLSFQDV